MLCAVPQYDIIKKKMKFKFAVLLVLRGNKKYYHLLSIIDFNPP